ncbi:GtrA family protein [Candidatus Nitrotoga sp. AM1P]|uniref:GtrA family protein n=1 Tax=Candidatus Nitrotoga sp. AM1P TaxID=2559597 RepID=UPI001563B676|nr:GtrA family protein [Candidatus Nitrotoga sp. AM1P]
MKTLKPGVQVTRYALIGVCNTTVHFLIVGLLMWLAEFNQMYANVTAYIVASFFSFLMNARWSFQSRPGARNYARFQLVSLLGLIVNATFGHLGDHFGWHFALTIFLISLTVPVISFLLHRTYTFSK